MLLRENLAKIIGYICDMLPSESNQSDPCKGTLARCLPWHDFTHHFSYRLLLKMMKKAIFLLALLLTLGLYACISETQSDSAAADVAAEQTEASRSSLGGLALYTLRDTMGKAPQSALRAVADLGYQYIEAAGYAEGKFYGMEPAAFKAYLDEVGLTPVSSHHGDVTLDNADQMIADVKAAGFQYFVIPVPPMGHFTFDRETRTMGMSGDVAEVMEIINAIARKCSEAGLSCLYHNHNFEFQPNEAGVRPMDYFIEHSDPEHLNFQLDLYWAISAGVDPVDYFAQAPGRFKAWHVKDMDEQGRFAPVGTGTIDFARIWAERARAGLEHYFVEQDMTFHHSPLEAVAISHEALGALGFE